MLQFSDLTIEKAVANQSGAMETGTISKNGASPKSLTSRGNFKIFALVVLVAGIVTVKSCKKDDSGTVPKNVIELVSSVDVFTEKEEWEHKEIVPERERSVTVPHDTSDPGDPPPPITRLSVDECFAYNTTWNCETTRHSASKNPDDFFMYNPFADVLWPGNLVQGASLESGIPTSIPVDIAKRRPGNISIAVVTPDGQGLANPRFRTVENMQFSHVNQAMNDVLADFWGNSPANYNISMGFAHSESQFSSSTKAGYSGPFVRASAAFDINWSESKTRMLVQLQQQYFTMVYDDPAGLDGVFTPDITVNDLRNYTDNGNPICYISSVTYGRIYYLLYESTASALKLQAAINFSIGRASGMNETDYYNTMAQTVVQVFQLGGDAQRGIETAWAQDLEGIKEFLAEGANVSQQSPGAQISYTVKFLKNAQMVRMNNTMEYFVENCVPETTENDCFKFFEPEMVYVQGGTFDMGENGENGQVTLSSYNIGKYEVTQAQWVAVMGSNPSQFKGDNLPVERVSWDDIVGTSGNSMVLNRIIYYENGFIYRLNKLTGKAYRLPTEAEWEYAARGGNKSEGYTYSGSYDPDKVAWYDDNSEGKTHPVGEKDSNELGIYDMSGNVLEWCSDWVGGYNDDPKTNPLGPKNGSDRVFRGGDWGHLAERSSVYEHGGMDPDWLCGDLGFRLVLP